MEFIFWALLILVGCLYYVTKTYLAVSDYNNRKDNCTLPVQVKVDSFKECKERMYLSSPNIWYIHTFSDIKNPNKKYYCKNSKCDSFEASGTQVTILIDPCNPEIFFYPGEIKPRTSDGVLCGVMSVLMILAIIMVTKKGL